MKAIMINSNLEIVYECQFSDDSYKRSNEIHDRLECNLIEVAVYFENGDVIFVDEDGLSKQTESSKFFMVNSQGPFIGNGLIVGKEIELGNDYTLDDVETDIKSLKIVFMDMNSIRKYFNNTGV